uniref:tRNA-binding domain-containing protein n=1 Tax=Entomoneis paludosa TaxID=265537 RepID=A0A6U3BZ72_9STRA|mmetsp:Transcript_28185/g.58988  ORF Transcript_28185/g.58988 Transcript_28185/m.58988 type:complete len:177 (+) Transcript_28185:81-611(+)
MADLSEYKVGIVLSVEDCTGGGNKSKPLRACQVNVGDEANPITVVTAASNVREGSRVAVAVEGSTVITEEGEEMKITKTTVGGVVSQGMFCDSRMLGWAGGAAGIAAQIPESIAIGESPPASKPRKGESSSTDAIPPVQVEGLYEKKLSKEEKKKLAEEKRKARKAAKEAKKAEGE